MNHTELIALVNELVTQPQESGCVEFKLNFHAAEEIGALISALYNGAFLFWA